MQKLLYLIMVLLGIYILGKGSAFLLEQPAVQETVAEQEVLRRLEDTVMRTLMPGYTAAVEGWTVNWMAWLLEPTVPVYGYLASLAVQETNETVESGMADASGTEYLQEPNAADAREAKRLPQDTRGTGDLQGTKQQETDEDSIISEKIKGGKADETVLPQETTPGEVTGESQNGKTDSERNDIEESDQNAQQQSAGQDPEGKEAISTAIATDLLQQLSDYDYLLNQYFTVDAGTTADAELLDASKLLTEDLSIRKNQQVPQILIYHTHSQEEFADSMPGDVETSIVGMGEVLAEALRGYGYQVIHDTGVYDLIDGVLDRSAAYDYARVAVEEILREYPTIEVVIDLHRDGVEGQKFVTEIDGKPTSMIMFFNGISRNSQDEPLTYLANPYTQQNLAFSLQLELAARARYPGYTRNIYLKAERFNLHLRPRSLLVEAGTQLNTVEEEKNAMQPLAELLNGVLSGK